MTYTPIQICPTSPVEYPPAEMNGSTRCYETGDPGIERHIGPPAPRICGAFTIAAVGRRRVCRQLESTPAVAKTFYTATVPPSLAAAGPLSGSVVKSQTQDSEAPGKLFPVFKVCIGSDGGLSLASNCTQRESCFFSLQHSLDSL